MKTRIVYPQLWLDEKFYTCSLETKVLFNYLINNLYLGLSPFVRISDRKIIFETNLTELQLSTAKKELTDLHWCFFYKDWIYHNHSCAYIDYCGNYKVEGAKAKEIALIPSEIRQVLKRLAKNGIEVKEELEDQSNVNSYETGGSADINHKSKTINHKLKASKGFTTFKNIALEKGIIHA